MAVAEIGHRGTLLAVLVLRFRLEIAEFQLFWEYNSPVWAPKFLDAWCKRAMRSRIEPLSH